MFNGKEQFHRLGQTGSTRLLGLGAYSTSDAHGKFICENCLSCLGTKCIENKLKAAVSSCVFIT